MFYIRCSKSDYGRYNVTEPPIDAPRDPLYKSTKEILKLLPVTQGVTYQIIKIYGESCGKSLTPVMPLEAHSDLLPKRVLLVRGRTVQTVTHLATAITRVVKHAWVRAVAGWMTAWGVFILNSKTPLGICQLHGEWLLLSAERKTLEEKRKILLIGKQKGRKGRKLEELEYLHSGLRVGRYDTDGKSSLHRLIKLFICYDIQVFLIKHYRNRRADDPDFFLDFEEIYVIDSKARSITRARVLVGMAGSFNASNTGMRMRASHADGTIPFFETGVPRVGFRFNPAQIAPLLSTMVTVPEGKNRDRKKDMLTVRDNGTSFKIIPLAERDDPTTVIEREDWIRTRREIEKHLRKLRDFSLEGGRYLLLASPGEQGIHPCFDILIHGRSHAILAVWVMCFCGLFVANFKQHNPSNQKQEIS
ncbi:hypothetical protein ACLOJK_014029 [Asimina triloba]